eukprot:440621_1
MGYFTQFTVIMVATYYVIAKLETYYKYTNRNSKDTTVSSINYKSPESNMSLQPQFERDVLSQKSKINILSINDVELNESLIKNVMYATRREKIKDKFFKMFNDKKEFSEFMDYYIMDMSAKNMMALIEIIQYQQLIIEYCNKQNISLIHINKYYLKIYFHSDIPQSYIVYFATQNDIDYLINDMESIGGLSMVSIDDQGGLKELFFSMNLNKFIELMQFKAYLIFDKYINYGSKYEIDINNEIKLKICNNMDNKLDWMDREEVTCNELMKVFGKICDDIISKMKRSYIRFIKQEVNKIKIFPCLCC